MKRSATKAQTTIRMNNNRIMMMYTIPKYAANVRKIKALEKESTVNV